MEKINKFLLHCRNGKVLSNEGDGSATTYNNINEPPKHKEFLIMSSFTKYKNVDN